MGLRARKLAGQIYSAQIYAVKWGAQAGSEFLEWLTVEAHLYGSQTLVLVGIPAGIPYDIGVIDRLGDTTAAVQEF